MFKGFSVVRVERTCRGESRLRVKRLLMVALQMNLSTILKIKRPSCDMPYFCNIKIEERIRQLGCLKYIQVQVAFIRVYWRYKDVSDWMLGGHKYRS